VCVSRGEVSSLSTLKRFGEQLTWVTASLQSVGPSPATACWPVSFFGCWPELMTSDLGPRTSDLGLGPPRERTVQYASSLGDRRLCIDFLSRRGQPLDGWISWWVRAAPLPPARTGSSFASLLPQSPPRAVFLASVGALNFSAFVNTSCISPASNCTYLAALDIGHLLALPC